MKYKAYDKTHNVFKTFIQVFCRNLRVLNKDLNPKNLRVQPEQTDEKKNKPLLLRFWGKMSAERTQQIVHFRICYFCHPLNDWSLQYPIFSELKETGLEHL